MKRSSPGFSHFLMNLNNLVTFINFSLVNRDQDFLSLLTTQHAYSMQLFGLSSTGQLAKSNTKDIPDYLWNWSKNHLNSVHVVYPAKPITCQTHTFQHHNVLHFDASTLCYIILYSTQREVTLPKCRLNRISKMQPVHSTGKLLVQYFKKL